MKHTYPLTSIVMCCYNSEQYLDRSIGSILAQTYPSIELIVVDDGSKDGSYQKAQSFEQAFVNKGYTLKVFTQPNQGPGYAAINGLQHVKGDTVSFLDSDDALLAESIEKRVNLLLQHPEANIARTNGYRVFEGTDRPKELLVITEVDKYTHTLFDDIVIGTANNFAGTFMVRTSALRSFYGDQPIPYSDYGQNLQLIMPGAYHSQQVYLDEPLMEYYIYPQSHSHKKSVYDSIRMYEGWYSLRKQLVENFAKDRLSLLKPSRIHTLRLILDGIYSTPDKTPELIQRYDRYYKELQSLGGITVELRMYNAMLHHSPFSIVYRIMFMVSRKLK